MLTAYHLRLAVHSMRRNPVLTLLMIAAIGVGVGAFMTVVNVYHVSSKNPIAHKNDRLYHIQLDNRPVSADFEEDREPYAQISYIDAMNLLREAQGMRQSASFKTGFGISAEHYEGLPIRASARVTTPDFFDMFDVPFLVGGAWQQSEGGAAPQVVVLAKTMSERLFGRTNVIGENVRLDEAFYEIVGIVDDWSPSPKFYDLTNGPWEETEQIFLPFALTEEKAFPNWGNTNCFGDGDVDSFAEFLTTSCVWISYWVELSHPDERDLYKTYLAAYHQSQLDNGRFEAPVNVRLRNVKEWLIEEKVTTDTTRVLLWLSGMFLTVCTLNTIGLVLAKFTSRTPQLALRRAVGATRGTLIRQNLMEITLIGVLGGVLGILLSLLGLHGMRILTAGGNTVLFEMDWFIMGFAIVVAVSATVIAAIYPAIRLSRLAPAQYLKTQ